MKNLFHAIGGKIAAWSVKQTVLASVITGLVVVGAASSVVVYQKMNEAPVAISDDETEKETEVKKPVVVEKTEVEKKETKPKYTVEIPESKDVAISGDSMELDLNVYFTDAEDKRISGTAFSVKLLSKEEAESLTPYVNQVQYYANHLLELEEFADEVKKAEEQDAQSSTFTSGTRFEADENGEICGLKKGVFASLTEYEQYALLKQEAIDDYGKAIEAIEATTLVDEDMDGKIYASGLDAGNFEMCYVPADNYEAKAYAVSVTVKEKIEYVPVENIEKKVEEYDPSKDVQVKNEESVELVDTLKWVESKVDVIPPVVKEATIAFPTVFIDSVLNENRITCGQNRENGQSRENGQDTETGEMEAYIGIPRAATVYSDLIPDDNDLSTARLEISGTNLNGIQEVTVTGLNYAVSPTEAEKYRLNESLIIDYDKKHGAWVSVQGWEVERDATATLTVVAKTLSGETISVSSTITVKGNTTLLKDTAGRNIYLKDDIMLEKPINYYEYMPNTKYYYVEKEGSYIYYGWQTLDRKRYYFDENGQKVSGKYIINGAAYTFNADGVLETSGRGCDVSYWQGKIDWTKLCASIDFCVMRCAVRYYDKDLQATAMAEDRYFERNIKGAKENGVKVGVYVYSMAMTEAEAVEEASLAVALCNKYGGIDLPIYFDFEDSTQAEGLSKEQKHAIANAFCRTVQAGGYRAGIYSYRWWMQHYMDVDQIPGDISIWIACPVSNPDTDTVTIYTGRYDIWQYSFEGVLDGITENVVDLDISFFT